MRVQNNEGRERLRRLGLWLRCANRPGRSIASNQSRWCISLDLDARSNFERLQSMTVTLQTAML